MKKILVLPTWLIARAVTITLKSHSHPWYGKKFSLGDWAKNSTPFNDSISAYFWLFGVLGIIGFLLFIHQT